MSNLVDVSINRADVSNVSAALHFEERSLQMTWVLNCESSVFA